MLFNSLDFAWFLPSVLLIYWSLARIGTRAQNFLLLIASYVFYGWWDWRFLALLFVSSMIDFFLGLGLSKAERPSHRRILLSVSIGANLTILGFFKYFNFFASSYADLMHSLGWHVNPITFSVILPVGISFYTFQSMSYGIDVYRRVVQPTRDMVTFLAYVSFFPQLMAGPIERASHLLPQFMNPRKAGFTDLVEGVNQLVWGLFKKVVIADNCSEIADRAFNQYSDLSAGYLLVGIICFSFQIYGDFSGYSDMAVGIARMFGFSLMRNFRLPYFSRDIAEFWRCWHISLSSWFRDYLYFPLGGSRGSLWVKVRNTLIVFLVSGLWHGANWTFVFWGLLHALYFMPLLLLDRNRKHTDVVATGRMLPSVRELTRILTTFSLVSVAWVFFRANSINDAVAFLSRIVQDAHFDFPAEAAKPLTLIAVMLVAEWFQRFEPHPLRISKQFSANIAFSCILWAILIWGAYGEKKFIYFQF